MFGINGFNPASLLATAALGPAGGIVAQLASQVFSQLGQQFLQNLGQQMGLPQTAIEMAQGSFASSSGDIQGTASNLNEAIDSLGRETGASPADIGDAQRAVDKIMQQGAIDAAQSDEAKEAKAGGKGGSWLLAIARALGAKADRLADKMEMQAENLDEGKPSDSAEFQATSQQFSMLMGALTTSIKTIGEALSQTARKQ